MNGWRNRPRPFLAVGVGSRWRTKRWPQEHFAVLVRQAQDRFGGTILFVGGRDETAIADAVAAKLTGPTFNFAGRTTLSRLTALLSEADVMLANDTGPLHLAAALGRPVVAPYTCTKALLTGPYGSQSGAVETRVWCAGQPGEALPAHGVHDGTDAGAPMAAAGRGITDMGDPQAFRLILASGSWGRRELLTQAGLHIRGYAVERR